MSEQGLRVLAFAMRPLDGREDAVAAGQVVRVEDLVFVGTGRGSIIDPLRPRRSGP